MPYLQSLSILKTNLRNSNAFQQEKLQQFEFFCIFFTNHIKERLHQMNEDAYFYQFFKLTSSFSVYPSYFIKPLFILPLATSFDYNLISNPRKVMAVEGGANDLIRKAYT